MDALVDATLGALTPTISRALKNALPQCYGNGVECVQGSAHHNRVYYKHKKWAYKVFANSIKDINALTLDSLTTDVTPNGKFQLIAKATYPHNALATEIYVGECFTFGSCSKIWENSNNFKGWRAVTATLTFDCERDDMFALPSPSNVDIGIVPSLIISRLNQF